MLTKFGTCRHVLLKLVTLTLGQHLFTSSRNVYCVPTNGRTDIRFFNYTFSTTAVAPALMYLYIRVMCRCLVMFGCGMYLVF